jgi:hypothetical protein
MHSGYPPFIYLRDKNVNIPWPQATAHPTCRPSRTALELNMGLRDNIKKAVGTVAAGLRLVLVVCQLLCFHNTLFLFEVGDLLVLPCCAASTPTPFSLSKLVTFWCFLAVLARLGSFALAPGVARAMDGVGVQPRLVLPSQEAYMNRY